MMYETHKVGGVCSGVIASTVLFSSNFGVTELISSGIIVAGATMGSLAPDIDHPTSKIGKKFLLKPISIFLNKFFGHRTITHSVIMAILMTIILFSFSTMTTGDLNYIYTNLVIGFSVGYFSHLLLDMFTVEGIPVFYPLIKRKYRLSKFKTGKSKKKEEIVSIIMIFITGIIMAIYLCR